MYRMTLPTSPGAILGYLRNGKPVRLIAGGSESAPEPPANGDPAAVTPPDSPQQQPAATELPAAAPEPSQQQPPQAGGQQPGTVDDLPGWAQKLIRETRTEAAAHRTKLKELTDAQTAADTERQRQMDKVAEAFGLKPGEVTPEQIAAERDAAQERARAATATARTTAIELAAFRAAAALQADPNKVLDSRAFVATLDGLDPADPAFAALVSDRVAAALEVNPAWRVTPVPALVPALVPQQVPVPAQVPGQPPYAPAFAQQPYMAPPPLTPQIPASGPQGSFTPPPPGPRQLTEADAAQMSPGQVVEAMNQGLFREEGFGANRNHGHR
jgi:hypothetical protein